MIVKTTHVKVKAILTTSYALATNGEKNLTMYGTKIAYRGGGWWKVSGYNSYGTAVLDTVNHLK